jgi:hypothetical protein
VGGARHFAGVTEALSTAYVRGIDYYYIFSCGALTHRRGFDPSITGVSANIERG